MSAERPMPEEAMQEASRLEKLGAAVNDAAYLTELKNILSEIKRQGFWSRSLASMEEGLGHIKEGKDEHPQSGFAIYRDNVKTLQTELGAQTMKQVLDALPEKSGETANWLKIIDEELEQKPASSEIDL